MEIYMGRPRSCSTDHRLQQLGPVSWPCLLRRQVDPVLQTFYMFLCFFLYKIKTDFFKINLFR